MVSEDNWRPQRPCAMRCEVWALLQRCWCADPVKRLTVQQIAESLQQIDQLSRSHDGSRSTGLGNGLKKWLIRAASKCSASEDQEGSLAGQQPFRGACIFC